MPFISNKDIDDHGAHEKIKVPDGIDPETFDGPPCMPRHTTDCLFLIAIIGNVNLHSVNAINITLCEVFVPFNHHDCVNIQDKIAVKCV